MAGKVDVLVVMASDAAHAFESRRMLKSPSAGKADRNTSDEARAAVAELIEALRKIEAMTPALGMNPKAKVSDPSGMKVCWNTQAVARAALARVQP